MNSDSDYVPSIITIDSPARTLPSKGTAMRLEVVIPVPRKSSACDRLDNIFKTTDSLSQSEEGQRSRSRIKDVSPIRSDSSVSLGTSWHISPKKKKIRRRAVGLTNGRNGVKSKKLKERSIAGKASAPSVRFEPISSSLPANIPLATSTPRLPSGSLRINLDSARLDHILAQESDRDTFIPASSPSYTYNQHTRGPKHRESPLFQTGSRLYASSGAGSSTAPGTQEWLKARIERLGGKTPPQDSSRGGSAASRPVLARSLSTRPISSQLTDLLDAPKKDNISASSSALGANSAFLPNISFSDPDYDLWARVGLRVALEEIVQLYGFPLDIVEKVYESKGSVAETTQFLEGWKIYMKEALVAESES